MISLEKLVDPKKPAYEIASTPLVSCTRNETIRNSVAMTLNGFSRIMVTERGELKGFVTSLDILDFLGGGPSHQLYVRYKKGMDLPVETIMTSEWHPLDKKHTVSDALRIFHKHGKDFHPVFQNEKFSGVVSEMDFIRQIKEKTRIRADEMMDSKPIVAKDHYNVFDVAKMLCRGEYRFLPVIKDNFLLGAVTPRDIISYLNSGVGLNNLRKADLGIKAAMNRDIHSIGPRDDIYEAIRIMNKDNLSVVPVTEETEMLGLITRRDVIGILS